MSEIKLTVTTGVDVVLDEAIKAIEEYIKNFEHSLRKQPNLKMNRRFEETLNNRRYMDNTSTSKDFQYH